MAKMDEADYSKFPERPARHPQNLVGKDFYTELPKHVKDGIERSRKQAEEGKLLSLEEVIERLNRR